MSDEWPTLEQSLSKLLSAAGVPPDVEQALLPILTPLCEEVRRLRSDEWLERAAVEVWRRAPTRNTTGRDEPSREALGVWLAILKRHRDGA